jgi:hypothetical protein
LASAAASLVRRISRVSISEAALFVRLPMDTRQIPFGPVGLPLSLRKIFELSLPAEKSVCEMGRNRSKSGQVEFT